MALLLTVLLATCVCTSLAQISIPLYGWGEEEHAAFLGMLRSRESNTPDSEEWDFKQDDPLNNYKMARYVGKIGVGTPAQSISVVYDTSQQLLTVPSSTCTDEICLIRDRYDPSKSKNPSKGDVNSEQLDYCSAVLDGFVHKDSVWVEELELPSQEFLLVRSVQYGQPARTNLAGLVGLGVTTLDVDPPQGSIFSSLELEGVFANQIMTLKLDRDASVGEDERGVIWFGGIDTGISVDEVNNLDFIDVIEPGQWTIQMDYVVPGPPGDVGYESWCPQGCKATLDSGTPYIVGPSDDIDEIHKLIGATQFGDTPLSKVDCDGVEDLPSIQFHFQGKAYILHGKDYIDILEDDEGQLCLSVFRADGQCRSDYDGWHLGQPFLQRHYTVFNLAGTGSVGFIPRSFYSL